MYFNRPFWLTYFYSTECDSVFRDTVLHKQFCLHHLDSQCHCGECFAVPANHFTFGCFFPNTEEIFYGGKLTGDWLTNGKSNRHSFFAVEVNSIAALVVHNRTSWNIVETVRAAHRRFVCFIVYIIHPFSENCKMEFCTKFLILF